MYFVPLTKKSSPTLSFDNALSPGSDSMMTDDDYCIANDAADCLL